MIGLDSDYRAQEEARIEELLDGVEAESGDGFARAVLECPTLTDRKRDVLCRRFGLFTELPRRFTLAELGRQYLVTGERIRQIEAKALRKVRKWVWGMRAGQ